MKRFNLVLVGLLLICSAAVAQSPGNSHVQDNYRSDYSPQLGGLGGGIVERAIETFVVYDNNVPSKNGTILMRVAVFSSGPGTDVAGTGGIVFSSNLVSTDCDTGAQVVSNTGVAAGSSWGSWVYEFTLEDDTRDSLQSCRAYIMVSGTDGPDTAMVLNAPVSVIEYNPGSGFTSEWGVVLVWGGLMLFLLVRRAFVSAFIAALMLGVQVFSPPLLPAAFGILVVIITLWVELASTGRILPKKGGGAES